MSDVERVICERAELAEADQKLAAAFSKALADAGDAAPRVRAAQRRWLEAREGCAIHPGTLDVNLVAECLLPAIQQRIVELAGPDHGMSTLSTSMGFKKEGFMGGLTLLGTSAGRYELSINTTLMSGDFHQCWLSRFPLSISAPGMLSGQEGDSSITISLVGNQAVVDGMNCSCCGARATIWGKYERIKRKVSP